MNSKIFYIKFLKQILGRSNDIIANQAAFHQITSANKLQHVDVFNYEQRSIPLKRKIVKIIIKGGQSPNHLRCCKSNNKQTNHRKIPFGFSGYWLETGT